MKRLNSQSANDLGLLLIRTMVGVVFVFHGAQKLFGVWGGPGLEGFTGFLTQLQVPIPAVSAVLAAVAEFGGGVALILGLGTRLWAVPLVVTMLVAAFRVHGSAFAAQAGGMEYALTLGLVTAGLALTGAGAWSLDALLSRQFAFTPVSNKIAPRRAATE
jgi:putative oxidoreductase